MLYYIKPSYRQVNSLANMESIHLHFTWMYTIWKCKKTKKDFKVFCSFFYKADRHTGTNEMPCSL